MKLKDYAKRLRIKASRVEQDLLAILAKHEEFILDLNREQMMQGIKANGAKIGEYKSETYEIMKLLYNPRGVMDLRLSGSFHNKMYMILDKLPGSIFSSDEKTEMLVNRYGKEIFGLTPANKERVRKLIEKDVTEYYRKLFML